MPRMKEPPWLVALVDQRLAELHLSTITKSLEHDFVMVPLTEPPEGVTDKEYQRWDETCDRCGAYVPGHLFPGHVMRTVNNVPVMIGFGVCTYCKDLTVAQAGGVVDDDE